MNDIKCEIYHDNFQNYKRYGIKKAQLVIADIPYNLGENAYGSNPQWYEGGDNKNGESKFAKSTFFNGDGQFKIAEYMHFCNKLLIKEPKEKGKAPAMIADRIGVSAVTINNSLNNKRDFNQREISEICDILNIPICNIDSYFFTFES